MKNNGKNQFLSTGSYSGVFRSISGSNLTVNAIMMV
jgi:hypothetical protein